MKTYSIVLVMFASMASAAGPQTLGDVDKGVKELVISSSENADLLSKLGQFKNLKKLTVVCQESLSRLPDSIGELTQLKELNMNNGNGCVMNPQLPESLGDLSHLEMLDLSGAQDNRGDLGKPNGPRRPFPGSMSKLKNLKVLNLSRNGFAEIPAFVRTLSGLKELDLSANDLADLPSWLNEIPHLKNVSIRDDFRITCSPKKVAALKKRFPRIKINAENEYDCPTR